MKISQSSYCSSSEFIEVVILQIQSLSNYGKHIPCQCVHLGVVLHRSSTKVINIGHGLRPDIGPAVQLFTDKIRVISRDLFSNEVAFFEIWVRSCLQDL